MNERQVVSRMGASRKCLQTSRICKMAAGSDDKASLAKMPETISVGMCKIVVGVASENVSAMARLCFCCGGSDTRARHHNRCDDEDPRYGRNPRAYDNSLYSVLVTVSSLNRSTHTRERRQPRHTKDDKQHHVRWGESRGAIRFLICHDGSGHRAGPLSTVWLAGPLAGRAHDRPLSTNPYTVAPHLPHY